MAFAPDYTHDIFVSYAEDDDEPLYGQEGWVTGLIRNLKVLLGRRLGGSKAYSLYSAHQLPGHVQTPDAVRGILQQSATFLIVLSPAYLNSEWCQQQLDGFLWFIKEHARKDSRIFVIERDQIEAAQRPSEFRDLRGYQFWIIDREGKYPRTLGELEPEQPYHNRLNDLAYELAQELKRLKAAAPEEILERQASEQPRRGQSSSETEAVSLENTVLLAQVTDDLTHKREELKRFLEQQDFETLPHSPYPYEPQAFQEALRRDLSRSTLFVQLLSGVPFKSFPDFPLGEVRCQYELALQQEGTAILQWRAPDLDLTLIQNREQRDFLENEHVVVMGLEDFKIEIMSTLQKKTGPKISPESFHDMGSLVFVDSSPNDADLSDKLCERLEALGVMTAKPWFDGDPAEIREFFAQLIRSSEALMILYGDVRPSWVVAQELEMRKILPQREEPLYGLAIYEGPPPENKASLPYTLPGMRFIDCREHIDEQQLRDFVAAVCA
ncbi:MAG: TIR domain-containing protein, partial [bacterium]|nr:TIR domain-containing protein [bacterium]